MLKDRFSHAHEIPRFCDNKHLRGEIIILYVSQSLTNTWLKAGRVLPHRVFLVAQIIPVSRKTQSRFQTLSRRMTPFHTNKKWMLFKMRMQTF